MFAHTSRKDDATYPRRCSGTYSGRPKDTLVAEFISVINGREEPVPISPAPTDKSNDVRSLKISSGIDTEDGRGFDDDVEEPGESPASKPGSSEKAEPDPSEAWAGILEMTNQLENHPLRAVRIRWKPRQNSATRKTRSGTVLDGRFGGQRSGPTRPSTRSTFCRTGSINFEQSTGTTLQRNIHQ
ncbi:hypothetical protein JVU11DRAFT_6554 [Chiua virens]|nr:hypothetical protein JVU11DRAFT_6554 [Chiua virens]